MSTLQMGAKLQKSLGGILTKSILIQLLMAMERLKRCHDC